MQYILPHQILPQHILPTKPSPTRPSATQPSATQPSADTVFFRHSCAWSRDAGEKAKCDSKHSGAATLDQAEGCVATHMRIYIYICKINDRQPDP